MVYLWVTENLKINNKKYYSSQYYWKNCKKNEFYLKTKNSKNDRISTRIWESKTWNWSISQ